MWAIFKVFIEFVAILLLFYVFFGQETCGILDLWSEIELSLPALEHKVLSTGPPGKSQSVLF